MGFFSLLFCFAVDKEGTAFFPTTHHQIPAELNPYQQNCENPKSRT
jgi:hypothetical protein